LKRLTAILIFFFLLFICAAPNAHATLTFPNGAVYQGQFKDGSFYGQGTFTFVDGEEMTGQWKDGEFVGE